MQVQMNDYRARDAMAPHTHDEPSLILVVAGGYVERIQGLEIEHRAGDLIYYPAHAVHSQHFGTRGARKIFFTPDAVSLACLNADGMSLDTARYVRSVAGPRIARQMLSEVRAHDRFTPLVLQGVALELVAEFGRGDEPQARRAVPPWLKDARDLICEGGDEALTVEAIAATVGRHPVHLVRAFRRHFGETPGACRRQRRLERAVAMLDADLTLSEIAVRCGFDSHSHFCRAFKAAYDVTPSQFRSARH